MGKDEGSGSTGTDNPVPSITLSITQDDVKRVLEASKAMAETLERIQKAKDPSPRKVDEGTLAEKASENGQTSKPDHSSTPLRTVVSTSDESSDGQSKPPTKPGKRPLHEMIFEAAQRCEHPMLDAFLDKMKASGSTSKEIRAGILVFHDMEMSAKLRLIFDVLGGESVNGASTGSDKENREVTLTREGTLSLFRSVIVAISSCIHQDKRVQVELEDKEGSTVEPPAKKAKVSETSPGSVSAKASQDISADGDSIPALQGPATSFDSSLATLKEEDDFTTSVVRKEFEEIANYASDRLLKYSIKGSSAKKEDAKVSFSTFEEWRASEGGKIAPWVDLFDLTKWRTPARSTARPKEPKSQPEAEKPPTPPPVSVKKEAVSPPRKEPTPAATPPKDTQKKQEATTEPAVPSPSFCNNTNSRTVVSFDFTGAMPDVAPEGAFCINITEDNLITLRNLVHTTGLACRPTNEITDILIGASKNSQNASDPTKVLPIERFHTCLHQLLGSGSAKRLSKADKDVFSSCFVDFFSCFNTRRPPLEAGEADGKDLAIGFSFLCAGSKSSKLAAGFELMESEKNVGLSTDQLAEFLRSYLTMLVGISLLTSSSDGVMKPKLNSSRRKAMFSAVENGARWTLSHFLKNNGARDGQGRQQFYTFEVFASWYTSGGYNVAPWLELLDLKKLLSLIGENDIGPKTPPLLMDALPPFPGPKISTPEYHSPPRRSRHTPLPTSEPFNRSQAPPPAEVLFTFPLANQRSLVVLREDASYVRGVVDQLGLLNFSPDEVWSGVYGAALKHPPVPPRHESKSPKNTTGKSMQVNKSTFVECMNDTIQMKGGSRKRGANGHTKSLSGARDVLVNFFHSFDLLQADRVCLNELMGGLTLLCGGKKSTKLAFAFGVFDRRPSPKSKRGTKAAAPANSLGGEDLFLFLRSFLIVMFSCCRQSWDLSDDAVNRYIADTANMVTDDVMRYQWRTKKRDRIDFDEFGQWYNEGGFESAPWLELLDLTKWVLVENNDTHISSPTPPSPGPSPGLLGDSQMLIRDDMDCPPAPPDDSVDPSFFDDDENPIMPMDSIDEMDIILMQPSQDRDNDPVLASSFSYSPGESKPAPEPRSSNSLKFHLVTDDDNGGYVISVSQKRISHLRHVLVESGLYRLDGEVACKQILGKSFRNSKGGRNGACSLTKDDFDSAMRGVISSSRMDLETQRTLSDLLGEIFVAFDYDGTGTVNAVEVACGFTVLCQGKKSDKLEYAFDVLDRERRGNLSRSDTTRYLRSFLTVLLNVVSTESLDSDSYEDTMSTTGGLRCERSKKTIARAVEAGSTWAADQAFRNRKSSRDLICFDEFAEWYTSVGYSNIPWLELLDLQKWAVTEP
jgi:Ca2+-binding EF-hand superfamily protein